MNANPYRWQSNKPKPAIERTELREEMVGSLMRGYSYVLIGGHGMGKSVFLTQLEARLKQEHVELHTFAEKPSPLDVKSLRDRLAEALSVGHEDEVRLVFDRWFDRADARNVVLLYDDIDAYVEDGSTVVRDFLDAVEKARREQDRIGVVVAGGVGVERLRTKISSSFLGGAARKHLALFTPAQLAELAAPFEQAGRPLDGDTLATLRLLTGGIPALAVYGLESLWELDERSPQSLTGVYERFRDEQEFFIESIRAGIGIDDGDEIGAGALWDYIDENDPPHSAEKLLKKLPGGSSPTLLNKVLRLLSASGLLDLPDDPMDATTVPSIVRPPALSPTRRANRSEQLRRDLSLVAVRISRWSQDFYQSARGDAAPELVQERVFSAFLASNLEASGWRVDREVQQGPGFPDIKLSHPAFPGLPDAIIEVKIWPHNDYKEVHQQVVSYQLEGEASDQTLAVVMLAKHDKDGWASEYADVCLAGCELEASGVDLPRGATLVRATRMDGPGAGVPVDHLLLQLPKRRPERSTTDR